MAKDKKDRDDAPEAIPEVTPEVTPVAETKPDAAEAAPADEAPLSQKTLDEQAAGRESLKRMQPPEDAKEPKAKEEKE